MRRFVESNDKTAGKAWKTELFLACAQAAELKGDLEAAKGFRKQAANKRSLIWVAIALLLVALLALYLTGFLHLQ